MKLYEFFQEDKERKTFKGKRLPSLQKDTQDVFNQDMQYSSDGFSRYERSGNLPFSDDDVIDRLDNYLSAKKLVPKYIKMLDGNFEKRILFMLYVMGIDHKTVQGKFNLTWDELRNVEHRALRKIRNQLTDDERRIYPDLNKELGIEESSNPDINTLLHVAKVLKKEGYTWKDIQLDGVGELLGTINEWDLYEKYEDLLSRMGDEEAEAFIHRFIKGEEASDDDIFQSDLAGRR